MSPRDIDSDEPFDFGQGFLVPANVSIDDYDSTPMISLPSLNIRDLETLEEPLAPELGNFTEFDLDTRAPKETKVFFGKTQVDYGCDASITKPLGEAIHSICGNGNHSWISGINLTLNFLNTLFWPICNLFRDNAKLAHACMYSRLIAPIPWSLGPLTHKKTNNQHSVTCVEERNMLLKLL
ncbi:hypothetical protein QSH57_016471 [Fusarium oxysporum f. sp. vasinfectum]|nr:hypothetical protein QSH57_016471 [Fusarium oxysporum f. sp. vasinfectum]